MFPLQRKRDCENEIQRKNDQIQVLSLNAESQVTEQQTRIEELSAKLEKLEELYDQSEKEKRSYEETFNSSAENVMKLQDEVKDLQTVKDQEIQALKFQLSTEEMKHHAAIKVCTNMALFLSLPSRYVQIFLFLIVRYFSIYPTRAYHAVRELYTVMPTHL